MDKLIYERELLEKGYKIIANDLSTYSCTIGDGGNFIAELEEESTISKVGLYWYNYKSRREIFDMYVSCILTAYPIHFL